MLELHYENITHLLLVSLITIVIGTLFFYIVKKKLLASPNSRHQKMVEDTYLRIKKLLAQPSGLGHKIAVAISSDDVREPLYKAMLGVLNLYYALYIIVAVLMTIILLYFVPTRYEDHVLILGLVTLIFLIARLSIQKQVHKEAVQILAINVEKAKAENTSIQDVILKLMEQ